MKTAFERLTARRGSSVPAPRCHALRLPPVGGGLAALAIGLMSGCTGTSSPGPALPPGAPSAIPSDLQLPLADPYAPHRITIVGQAAFDGGGLADVIVGAPGNGAGGNEAGAAYVVYGTGAAPTAVDLGAFGGPVPANAAGFKIVGEAMSDLAGWSVSGAGDVNGDGLDDVIVGAPGNDAAGLESGAAYVVFGFGHADMPVVDLDDLGGPTPDYDIGFKITGEAALKLAGNAVSGAGDVNADGYADLIVGAPDFIAATIPPPGGTTSGAAYVIYGVRPADVSNVDLADLAWPAPNNAIGRKIIGESILDNAGYSVSAAGDVNGDGYADIIVGAPQNGSGGHLIGGFPGAAYVIYGKHESNVDLGDLAGPVPDNEIGFKIAAEVPTFDFVGRSVSGAGDFDRDGLDDVIVGAPGNDAGGSDAGIAYVVTGRPGRQANVWLGTGQQGIVGDAAGDLAGYSVSGAVDFNADGHADVIVGTFRDAPNGTVPGVATVVAPWTLRYAPRPGVAPTAPSRPPPPGGG